MNEQDIQFTKDWWGKLVKDEPRLLRWLIKMHRTEADGYQDNIDAANKWATTDAQRHIFLQTAEDEKRHAFLMERMIAARGGVLGAPETAPPPSYYWEQMEASVDSLEACAAVCHLGEKLAADRFTIMLEHPDTPIDVWRWLAAVTPDEKHHARIFRKLSTPEAIAKMQLVHDRVVGELKNPLATALAMA